MATEVDHKAAVEKYEELANLTLTRLDATNLVNRTAVATEAQVYATLALVHATLYEPTMEEQMDAMMCIFEDDDE